MNLNGIMLGSENAKKLSEFYAKILGKPGWEDKEWTGWQVGDGWLTIGPHSEVKGQNSSPGRIMMMFTCDDIKAEFKRIKDQGAKVIAAPYQPDGGDGMWLATLADPDGNYFQLCPPWSDDQK